MLVKLLRATASPEYIAGLAALVCRNLGEAVKHATEYGMLTAKLEKLCEACRQAGHMSVFEHVSYTFLIDGISRACSHQLVRHRLASFTQASQRHTKPNKIVSPPGLNIIQSGIWAEAMKSAFASYEELTKHGVSLEDARSVLPNAASTTLVMTMNARELAHFLELRLCNKAQTEIRELAQEIHKLAKEHFPLLFEHVGPPCMEGQCREAKPCKE